MTASQNRWIERGVIAVSIIMCFVLFIQDRSLLLDSLNVARNIGERSFIELISPLHYEQSAPLLFLWISKVITSGFGISHFTLRFLPLIAAIGSIFLFENISKRLLNARFVYVAIFWLGSHQLFARYATEYKQYMVDMFAVLLIFWAVLELQKLTKANWWKFALLSSAVIWLSMPSIFIIISAFVYFMVVQWKEQNSFLPFLFSALVIALSFIANYLIMLSPTIGSDHMQNFHNNFFLEGKFWNVESVSHDFGLIVSQAKMVVGKSGLAIASILIFIMTAVYTSIRIRQFEIILLLLPVAGAFGASLIGMYSILERLMLFALPLYILMASKGLEVLFESIMLPKKYLVKVMGAILIFGLLVGFYKKQSFKYILDPFEHEDNRSSLLHIANHASHMKKVVCTQHAVPAYDYYTNFDKCYKEISVGEIISTQYGDDILKITENNLLTEVEVWILANHYLEPDLDKLISDLDGMAIIKNSYRAKSSAAILISR